MDRRDEATKNGNKTLVQEMLDKHGKNPHIRHEDDDKD
jgi:hypothetical protein